MNQLLYNFTSLFNTMIYVIFIAMQTVMDPAHQTMYFQYLIHLTSCGLCSYIGAPYLT